MANYNYTKDKVLGDIAENKVLQMLHDSGHTEAYRVKGKEVRWDIVIPDKDIKIEVKNDIMAQGTGNLAIEMYKQSGEASGIMASESDFWVIFAADEIYMLDRPALKDYIRTANHRVVMGGDRKATQMMLVPIDDIKQQTFFRRLG